MTIRFFAAAAAAVFAISATRADAQASLVIAGGATVPVSTLADLADVGFNAAVGLNLRAPMFPVTFRVEGAYNGLQVMNASGDVRIISGTLNGIYRVGRAGITETTPYLIGGVGAYNRRVDIDPFRSTGDMTVVGLNGGGGLIFPLGGLTTFFEARYHVMLGDKSEAANYQFIPITFGIVF